MQKFKMWINGKFVNADSGKTFTTRNPATGETITIPAYGYLDAPIAPGQSSARELQAQLAML